MTHLAEGAGPDPCLSIATECYIATGYTRWYTLYNGTDKRVYYFNNIVIIDQQMNMTKIN